MVENLSSSKFQERLIIEKQMLVKRQEILLLELTE